MRRSRLSTAVTACVLGASIVASTSGCAGRGAADDGKLRVVAAFYPLQFISERVGGDRVVATTLVKPGAEPHDLELRPQQAVEVSKADLVVYLRGFQPAVDATVDKQAAKRAFDAAAVAPLRDAPAGTEEEEGGAPHANEGKDPHVWLDPVRFGDIATALGEQLARRDTAHAEEYRSRAAALKVELAALDGEYGAGLANCQRHEIVTSHAAFGYLAERYKLTQIAITGISPEDEPTPQHLAEVATYAKSHKVTTIFFETLVSPKVAETLAREVGAMAEVLDPIEGLEPGSSGDYFSVMRSNLGKLRKALSCT